MVGFTIAGGGTEANMRIAAVIFGLAALTDFVDGYLARRWHIETVLGAFLDTTADKVLVIGSLVGLVAVDRVWVWAALVIIFREIAVMGLRGIVAVTGAVVKPSQWGKIKAAAQFVAIFLALLRLPEPWGPFYLDEWVMLLAVIATIGSFWGYMTAFWSVVRGEVSGSKAASTPGQAGPAA